MQILDKLRSFWVAPFVASHQPCCLQRQIAVSLPIYRLHEHDGMLGLWLLQRHLAPIKVYVTVCHGLSSLGNGDQPMYSVLTDK